MKKKKENIEESNDNQTKTKKPSDSKLKGEPITNEINDIITISINN